MPVRSRFALSAIAIIALIGGASVAPAFADDPPSWAPVPGHPVVTSDYSVGIETAIVGQDPLGGGASLDPVTIMRPVITNTSDHDITFGFGIDIDTAGEVERLWTQEAWNGPPADPDQLAAFEDFIGTFTFTLAAGQSMADVQDGVNWLAGVPQYPGRTGAIYTIDGTVVTEIARFTAPGRFVPITMDINAEGLPPAGVDLAVVGPDEGAELFPGLTATARATGLPPGEQLQLWIAPNFDFFFFHLLGANLPADARQVGVATVDAGGALETTIEVPSDIAYGSYALVAGVRAEHYWPAGSYTDFRVVEPTESQSVELPGDASEPSITLGSTTLDMSFPEGTSAGSLTATVSATGPVASGFTLAGELYYHIDTTATLGGPVTICVTYDTDNIPGDPPWLYHYEAVPPDGHRWTNITTTREAGRVCGATDTFSPFALGHELDDGSTKPPAKGVLHTDNGWDTGIKDGDYNVVWDMWWGENARTVRVLENGVVVGEKTLARSTPSEQHATFPIAGRANGTYVYTAELVNSRGTTTTAPLTVKVTQANPAAPVLSASGNVKGGSYTVTANLWWGTNATSYTFYENGTAVATGSLTAATPGAQSASHAVTGKTKGTYVYTVVFANAAGETSSKSLTVKVTK